MEQQEKLSKLEYNKVLLDRLLAKRKNLDDQIENLRLRIKNQEKALDK
jgi:uncharacterized protein YdcH (DUF465 family)